MAARNAPIHIADESGVQAPLRIMHIICSADPRSGGPIEGATQLGDVWRSQGHVQHLVTMDSPDEPFLKECSSPVIALGRSRRQSVRGTSPLARLRNFRYAPGAAAWMRTNAHHYDVAIVSGLWNYATMAARRILPGGTLPYLVFTHGMLDPWFKQQYPLKHWQKQLLWFFNEGVLMRRASAVLFTRDEERILAENAFWPYRVRPAVIGYGISAPSGDPGQQVRAFRNHVPALDGRKYLLFLSRIHPKKGCDLLIRAFAGIAGSHPDLDLVMAGPDQIGWKAELEGLADSLGVSRRIHWIGMVQGDVKWGAYHGSEAFVLTSHSENFGIVVAEAMACAKPVLITNKVNLWREVAASGGGLVEDDTQEGAEALLSKFLSMGSPACSAMSAAARDCFERHFQAEGAARRAIEVMREAISRQRATTG